MRQDYSLFKTKEKMLKFDFYSDICTTLSLIFRIKHYMPVVLMKFKNITKFLISTTVNKSSSHLNISM